MIYYMIRHKASGEFMPEMQRGKGYSWWNPTTNSIPTQNTGTPRLFSSRRRAFRTIVQWNCIPNGKQTWARGDGWNEELDIDIRNDGRSKDDLEIVEVDIVEVKKE